MLTVTLRTLEADGLVSRTVYAEVPPRVEYQLTETGKTLIPHIESLVGWALEHMTGIFETAGKRPDNHADSQNLLHRSILRYIFISIFAP